MCAICLDLAKNKMTSAEAKKALEELQGDISPEHKDEVEIEIAFKEIDEIGINEFMDFMDEDIPTLDKKKTRPVNDDDFDERGSD
jgi:hypothetical protein